MAAGTGIEWTEVTWNPTTGCNRVSPGCDNCYALALAKRLKAMGQAKYQNDGDPRTSGPGFALTLHPDALAQPYGWGGRRLVFVNSMSDLFHARVPLSFVRQVFAVIADTPQHTYQVLTKRSSRLPRIADKLDWPPNLWMGVSVEDASAMPRVDDLRAAPAHVRFLSCEPLLGPLPGLDLSGIGWVIAGGESGPGHRPVHPAWVAAIRDSVRGAGCAVLLQAVGRADPESRGTRARRACVGRAPAARLASAEPDGTCPGDPPWRAHCDFAAVQKFPDRPGGVRAAPPRRLRQEPAAELLHRDLPGLKALGHQVEQLVLRRPGARPQGHLAQKLPAAGAGITKAHAVVTVNVPHGLFHHLDPLLVLSPEDQVQRLTCAGNDLELQLVTEARTP